LLLASAAAMTLELPLLTLGLAGFTSEQDQAIAAMLARGVGEATQWKTSELDAADAWWLHGGRTQALGGDRIRIASGLAGGRSIQLHMPDVDRPVGFARPLPLGFNALCSFDLADPASMKAVLQQFESWLAPITAQFCLAEHIVEHQSALAAGIYELRLGSQLLAVVDMQGEVAVCATLTAADFEGTYWHRGTSGPIPEHFARASLAQLMWQYTVRTQRELLPKRYRTGLLYFRRAPHLPQRMITNSHLLIMRELMLAPATFEDLQQRCGFAEARLARKLASLYFVGSITSNPKRAARTTPRPEGSEPSALRSNLDSMVPSELPPARQPRGGDLTAPAPLRQDH
jgi:hypothetical protein